jgi:hypothetical protein
MQWAHLGLSAMTEPVGNEVEEICAAAAIQRALGIYQQLQNPDRSVCLQARKILTQHIYAMVDMGERDEKRLTVGGLAHLKSIERGRPIKSAHDAPKAHRNAKPTSCSR